MNKKDSASYPEIVQNYGAAFDALFRQSSYRDEPECFVDYYNETDNGQTPITLHDLNTLRRGEVLPGFCERAAETIADMLFDDPNIRMDDPAHHAFIDYGYEAAQGHKEVVAKWRDTNPKGSKGARSFAEMTDETWANGGRLSDLFNKISEAWDIPKTQQGIELMRAVIARSIAPTSPPGANSLRHQFFFGDHVLQGNSLNNVLKLAQAFNLDLQHELKLWRIAAGNPYPEIGLDQLEQTIDQALEDPENRDLIKDIFRALDDTSGILSDRIVELASSDQNPISKSSYYDWLSGNRKPQNKKAADQLMKILLPEFLCDDPEKLRRIREKAALAVTQRTKTNNFVQRIKQAKTANPENAARHFIEYYVGKKGSTGKTIQQMADEMGVKRHTVVNRLFGANIDEDFAQKVAKFLGAQDAKETEQIVEFLTGVPNARKLIRWTKMFDQPFPEAARRMKKRKKYSNAKIAKAIGSNKTPVEGLEQGNPVRVWHAHAHARLFFPPEDQTSNEFYYHVCYAVGLKPLSPTDVIEQLGSKQISAIDAFKYMLVFGGNSFDGLEREENIGISHDTIRKYAAEHRLCPKEAGNIAEVLGLDVKYLMPFCVNHPDYRVGGDEPARCARQNDRHSNCWANNPPSVD